VWHQLVGELVARHAHRPAPPAPTPATADLAALDPALHGLVVAARTHDQFLLGLSALLDGLLPAATRRPSDVCAAVVPGPA
jgi:hypothetical protein